MENSKTPWTPGPWEACGREDYMDDGIVILGDDRRIAVANTESDARLIAAAPEMAEFIQRYIDVWKAGTGTIYLIEEAESIIARIEGKS